MTQEIDLYGPPGTGKTTRLTRLALSAATQYGPTQLGAVTYTRAAATELKGRIAASLGIRVPETPQGARMTLDREIPWVGTVHALCYKMIGRPPMLTGPELTTFARTLNPNAGTIITPSVDFVEGFEYNDIAGQDEVTLTLQLYAQARHRMRPIAELARELSYHAAVMLVPERAEFIARRYEDYKRDLNKIDFEDMLAMGRDYPLPVTVLLCDEVQDNSALLWSVIESWMKSASLVVMAGDPWQAIYIYMGAQPSLFRDRAGRWATIGNSHRLSAQTAVYALDLLRRAGYQNDSLLKSWVGVGGEPKDSTRFFLARTNALLREIRSTLEAEGEPYRLLRGIGPLQMNSAKAFRMLNKDGWTWSVAHQIAECLPPGRLPHGLKAKLKRGAEETPDAEMPDDFDRACVVGNVANIPNWDYLSRVWHKHGTAGLVLTPLTQVGTIHAAKGREADEVTLVRSWGTLPGRSMLESVAGRQSEACVAYVGATRHRTKLTILDTYDNGIPYPFPAFTSLT